MAKARSSATTRPVRAYSTSSDSTGPRRAAQTLSQRQRTVVVKQGSTSARPVQSSPRPSRQRIHPSRQEQLRRRLAYQQAQAQKGNREHAAAMGYPLAYPFWSKPKPLAEFKPDWEEGVQAQITAAETLFRTNWVPHIINNERYRRLKQTMGDCDTSKADLTEFLHKKLTQFEKKEFLFNVFPEPSVCQLLQYDGIVARRKWLVRTVLVYDTSFCFTGKLRQFHNKVVSSTAIQTNRDGKNYTIPANQYIKDILARWMAEFFKLIVLLSKYGLEPLRIFRTSTPTTIQEELQKPIQDVNVKDSEFLKNFEDNSAFREVIDQMPFPRRKFYF